ncbi:hypothetical protein CDL12_22336 [Handroanthus impetiginosus]|uniref:RING-type E3 ubiquitin transferase n=1 Tax=Handroanthus impetiginosus TaxID=429701 RepID=A0A2G9GIU9_9LAMI|nr:hypothetical protein CDL12_22336 [Handroanthus impetiginosus]
MNISSFGSPNIWAQYMNNKDCSQGFCSLYCPQWCFIIFPPPPPFEDFPDNNTSSPKFSPFVIIIIGILAGAFLLVSYYAIISKYCSHRFSSSARAEHENNHDPDVELGDGDQDEPTVHEPWFVTTNGLDEALIRSIAVVKYKRGQGIIEGSDCCVCLSEFEEDDRLRLLPKCSHAFHLPCIDTWLKSHSNCPLCRANIAFLDSRSSPHPNEALTQSHGEVENVTVVENVEIDMNRETSLIRRSVSMDCICEERLSMADVLLLVRDDEEDCERGDDTNRNRRMWRRSYSSGRWFFSKCGRASNSVIPF